MQHTGDDVWGGGVECESHYLTEVGILCLHINGVRRPPGILSHHCVRLVVNGTGELHQEQVHCSLKGKRNGEQQKKIACIQHCATLVISYIPFPQCTCTLLGVYKIIQIGV